MNTIVIIPEDVPRIKTLSFKTTDNTVSEIEKLSNRKNISKGNLIYQILTKGILNKEDKEAKDFFLKIVKNDISKKSKESKIITVSCKFTKNEFNEIKDLSKEFNISTSQLLDTSLKESLPYVKRD